MTTLVLAFKKIESKENQSMTISIQAQKAETIINETDIENELKSIYTTIIANTQKSLGKS